MPLSDGFSDLCLQPACCQAAVAAAVVKPFRYEWADCCSHVPTCADAYMGLFVFVHWVLRIIFSEVRRLEPWGFRPGKCLPIQVLLQRQLCFPHRSNTEPCRMKSAIASQTDVCASSRIFARGPRARDLCPAVQAWYCIISTWHYDRDQRLMMWIRQEPDIGPWHVLNLRCRRLQPGLITLLIIPRSRSCKQEYLQRQPLYTH